MGRGRANWSSIIRQEKVAFLPPAPCCNGIPSVSMNTCWMYWKEVEEIQSGSGKLIQVAPRVVTFWMKHITHVPTQTLQIPVA